MNYSCLDKKKIINTEVIITAAQNIWDFLLRSYYIAYFADPLRLTPVYTNFSAFNGGVLWWGYGKANDHTKASSQISDNFKDT